MSDRERWTIYPLLFLALALGLRDRLFPPQPPRAMALRELTITGEEGRPEIRLSGSDVKGTSPSIQILNKRGSPSWLAAVIPQTGIAVQETGAIVARDIRVVGPEGKPRVAIGVRPGINQGVIEWLSADGKQLLAAGGLMGDSGAITSFRGAVEQFSLGANERGTIVLLRNSAGKPYLMLACDDNGTGRGLVFDREGNAQLLIGQPVAIKLQDVDSRLSAPEQEAPRPATPDEQKPGESKADSPASEPAQRQEPIAPAESGTPP